MEVTKVKIDLFGNIKLTGVVGYDHHKDTLFYIQELEAKLIQPSQAFQSNIIFNTVNIKGVDLNLRHYEGDSLTNLEYFVQGLRLNQNQNQSKAVFRLNKLTLQDGSILFDLSQLKTKIQKLEGLAFEMEEVFIEKKNLSAKLRNLVLEDDKGRTLKNVSGEIVKTARFLSVNNIAFETQESQLMGAVKIMLTQQSDIDSIKLDLSASRLHPSDWGGSNYYNKPLCGQIIAGGPLENITINKIDVDAPDFSMQASGLVTLDSSMNFRHLHSQISSFTLSTDWLSEALSKKNLKINGFFLPEESKVGFRGSIDYSKDEKRIDGIVSLTSQNLQTYIQESFTSMGDTLLKTVFRADPIRISEFLPASKLGEIVGELRVEGQKINGKWNQAKWLATIDSLEYQSNYITNIQANGTVNQSRWAGSLRSSDNQLQLDSQFIIYPKSKNATNTVDITLNRLDVHLVNPLVQPGNIALKGVTNGSFKGVNLDLLAGQFRFNNILLTTQNDKIPFEDFLLEMSTDGFHRTLSISDSDILEGSVEGNFQLSRVGQLFKNTVSRAYPFALTENFADPQYAEVNMILSQKVLSSVFPQWGIKNDFTFKGLLHSEPEKGGLTIDAPIINYKNSIVKGLSLRMEPESASVPNMIRAEEWRLKNYILSDVSLLSEQVEDKIQLNLNAFGGSGQEDKFYLNVYHDVGPDKELDFTFQPSYIQFKGDQWDFNPTARIRFDGAKKTLSVSDFSLRSGKQKVSLNGQYSNKQAYNLDFKMQEVSLAQILPDINKLALEGTASVAMKSNRSRTQNDLDLRVEVEGLSLNTVSMGDLSLSSFGNNQIGSYISEINLQKGNEKTLVAKGNLINSDSPSMNVDVTFDSFALNFLNPLINGGVNGIKGVVSGSANLWGPLKALRHDGFLILSNGGLTIPYLNVSYEFEEQTQINLRNQEFTFLDTPFANKKFNTIGKVAGNFSHTNFKNWTLNFSIKTPRMLIYDINNSSDRIFYGQGFFGGKGTLFGPAKALTISLDGETEEGTNIKIPWTEDYGLVDTSYIDFISKATNDTLKKTTSELDPSLQKILEMDFELDVTDKALIEIVIDPETNSSLSGRGVGTLLIDLNTNNRFNMWGDFLTTEGIYNFRNLGLIDKKFSLQPGGTVIWEGDPLGAQMNMEAVYKVPGGANPALLLDNPNFNRKIPTDVAIQLQGNLLKPDDPVFKINFPNTNNVVVSEINYRLADPQRSQLQAISLLSQGVFISDVSVSVQGITNNLYEKASDVLSNLLGESDEKLKVGVNYLQGDRNNELSVETEDRLGLTLSTQISDKILVNGKIGVPVGGVAQTQVVGDVQIDFILNDKGSLRAKVFNKENEFRYIGEDFGYTQGMGLSYDVDFNTFQELIQKIKRKARRDSIKTKSPVSQPKLVEFRDKNN